MERKLGGGGEGWKKKGGEREWMRSGKKGRRAGRMEVGRVGKGT